MKRIKIVKDELIPLFYKDYLNNLYLPLVKGKGIMLYSFLLDLKDEYISEKQLLSKLELTKDEFLKLKKILGSLDLIEYFKSKFDDNEELIILNPPLPPTLFFSKKHLVNLLENELGKDEVSDIREKSQARISDDYENLTPSFYDVYGIEIDNSSNTSFEYTFKSKLKNNSELGKENIIRFSLATFFQEIKKNSLIDPKVFNNKDIEEIERIADLYEVKEKDLALETIKFYSSKLTNDSHFNFQKIEQNVIKNKYVSSSLNERIKESKSQLLAKSYLDLEKENKRIKKEDIETLVDYYNNTSPLDLLRDTLNGKEPSKIEKNIISTLANEYNLNRGMINCIIHYALIRDKNVLYKNNVISYLNPILRSNIKDVYQMMDYLYKEDEYQKMEEKFKESHQKKIEEIEETPQNESEIEEEYDLDIGAPDIDF